MHLFNLVEGGDNGVEAATEEGTWNWSGCDRVALMYWPMVFMNASIFGRNRGQS